MLELINEMVKLNNEVNEIAFTKVFREDKRLDALCITTLHNGEWQYVEVTEMERKSLSENYLHDIGLSDEVVNIIMNYHVQDIIYSRDSVKDEFLFDTNSMINERVVLVGGVR